MKFTIDYNHRDYFQKNGAIQFEELLSEEQAAKLLKHANTVLSNRLKTPFSTPENLFFAGRDLYKSDPEISKIVSQKGFAEIAYELLHKKPIRLGYDQFIPSGSKSYFASAQLSLQQLGSLQGVIGGLILCIKAPDSTHQESKTLAFPAKVGHGTFLSAEATIDFSELSKYSGSSYLLIVYASESSVFILNETDPFAIAMKNYGYSLGDKLKDKINPIVFR